MNQFPKFDPNDPAHTQLTSTKLNQVSLGQKSNQIQPGIGYRVCQSSGGTTVSVIKRRTRGGATGVPCYFGEVIDIEGGKAIRGGSVKCGDKNFHMDDEELPSGDGAWLVSIKLDCESLRDDDNEVFLPGIKTSSDTPVFDFKAWSEGTDYDDNSDPSLASGIGSIVVPLGKLTKDDDVPKFGGACGKITITQCDGILDHTRG